MVHQSVAVLWLGCPGATPTPQSAALSSDLEVIAAMSLHHRNSFLRGGGSGPPPPFFLPLYADWVGGEETGGGQAHGQSGPRRGQTGVQHLGSEPNPSPDSVGLTRAT